MATRFTTEEALDAILNDDFGLSDGEDSEMEGEDIYGYLGESVLDRGDVEDLSHGVAPGNDDEDADDRDDPTDKNDSSERNEDSSD